MSPTASRPGRPRSAAAHVAILGAAIALVREVGYDAVTIEGIAERAGVGKATLYRWWPSRELLVVEAIGQIVRAIPVPDTGRAEADILALMRASMMMYADPATGPLLSGLVAAMARHPAVADAVRTGFVREWRTAVHVVLRRAAARGELRRRLDTSLALDLLAGPLFYRYLMLGVAIDERFIRRVVRSVLRGLAPATAARRSPPSPLPGRSHARSSR